ncbi:hypothetical protein LB505_004293 [Fusarium chuoi]|nr:hypothetical protein LB505_004293 [Fusarium chuoi]
MGPSSNFDPNQPIPHKSLDNTSLSPSRVILKARPHCPAQTINRMFLQRSALTAARRVAARPAVARTFTTSFRSELRRISSVLVPPPELSLPISSKPPVSSVSRFSVRWRASTSSTCALSTPAALER